MTGAALTTILITGGVRSGKSRFAQELAQTIAVMDRGDIVLSGRREELNEADVRRRLSV